MNTKSTFIFNYDWREALKAYPAKVRLEVYETLIDYAHTGEEPENLSPLANLAFLLIKREIDFNSERYNAIIEKRREAANRRWKKGVKRQERPQSVAEAEPQEPEAEPATQPEATQPEHVAESSAEDLRADVLEEFISGNVDMIKEFCKSKKITPEEFLELADDTLTEWSFDDWPYKPINKGNGRFEARHLLNEIKKKINLNINHKNLTHYEHKSLSKQQNRQKAQPVDETLY